MDLEDVLPRKRDEWVYHEIVALIQIWSAKEIQKAFGDLPRNKPVWMMVAQKMHQLGFRKSWMQCSLKMKNLISKYKKVKHGMKESCNFYEELDAVLGHKLIDQLNNNSNSESTMNASSSSKLYSDQFEHSDEEMGAVNNLENNEQTVGLDPPPSLGMDNTESLSKEAGQNIKNPVVVIEHIDISDVEAYEEPKTRQSTTRRRSSKNTVPDFIRYLNESDAEYKSTMLALINRFEKIEEKRMKHEGELEQKRLNAFIQMEERKRSDQLARLQKELDEVKSRRDHERNMIDLFKTVVENVKK